MKAKTKLQKRVVQLSEKLPVISKAQENWAFLHCFEFFGYFGKKSAICFECGFSWNYSQNGLIPDSKGCSCPNCGRRLTSRESKRMFTDCAYFAIITSYKGFQVLRFFFLKKWFKQGQAADTFIQEVCQNWINSEGNLTVMGKAVQGISGYYDQWIFSSKLEIRNYHMRFNICTDWIYPRMSLIKEVKRNGFSGNFYNLSPTNFLCTILSNSQAETLLKTGQIPMFSRFIQSDNLSLYWPSIKICIRNNYLIQDARIWCDHINTLKFFGKDILNPKFVCPDDLKQEHQRLTQKMQEIFKKQRIEARKAKLEQEEQEFVKEKGKFFGLTFSDEEINVSTIESVAEFIQEGEELHHCVYTNEYYKETESLILSAKKENKRLETIEISLNDMTIVQCRGLCNENTPYHDKILSLVERNLNLIQRRCG